MWNKPRFRRLAKVVVCRFWNQQCDCPEYRQEPTVMVALTVVVDWEAVVVGCWMLLCTVFVGGGCLEYR